MKLEPCFAHGFVISDVPGLDNITVLIRDTGPGAGYLTVTCYNLAWTTYWGAMGEHGVRAFVASCDVGYLVNNLIWGQKITKAERAYVSRVAEAVIAACKVSK